MTKKQEEKTKVSDPITSDTKSDDENIKTTVEKETSSDDTTKDTKKEEEKPSKDSEKESKEDDKLDTSEKDISEKSKDSDAKEKEDDDDKPLSQLKEEIKSGKVAASSAPESSDDKPPTPPPKPPRPLSPFSQAHLTLSEAFPSVDTNVVRAVLIASSGMVDPAFNGLLSLTDPDYKLDEDLLIQQQQAARHAHSRPQPPPGVLRKSNSPRYRQAHGNSQSALNKPHPPLPGSEGVAAVPASGHGSTLLAQRAAKQASAAAAIRSDSAQIEEDEKLARLLAAEYDSEQRRSRRVRYADTGRGTTYSDPRDNRRRDDDDDAVYEGRYGIDDYDDDDDDMYRDRSFFDDELPQLRDNLTKGFNETKDKVNSWVENLKKKIDGDDKNPGVFAGLFGGNGNENNGSNARYGGSGSKSGFTHYYDKDGNITGYQPVDRRNPQGIRGFDRDPEEFEFNRIQMQNHDVERDNDATGPRLPRRPGANSYGSDKTGGGNQWESLNPVAPDRSIPSGELYSAVSSIDNKNNNTTKSSTTTDTTTSTTASTATTIGKDGKDLVDSGNDSAGNNTKKIPLKSETPEDDDPFFIGDSDEDEDEGGSTSPDKKGSTTTTTATTTSTAGSKST